MSKMTLLLSLSLAWQVCACAEDQDEVAEGETLPQGLPCEPEPPAGVDPSAGASFDDEHMLCVRIEIDEADFAELRSQDRAGTPSSAEDEDGVLEVLAALTDCTKLFPNEFTWFESRVDVDGAVVEHAGIRKKGFIGSVHDLGKRKPALKIKTDKFVDGQLLGETERITLNNIIAEPTRLRMCVALEVFDAAGYPAPMCNLANVMVNGESLGSYVHVEAIKKRFLARAFGDAAGSLYEPIFTDFNPESIAPLLLGDAGRWEPKTDDSDPTGAPVLAVYEAMQVPDAELLASLEPVLDVDRFITFWVLEALLGHGDGYAGGRNNYYIYFDPSDGGRAVFIPWGTDHVFVDAAGLDAYLVAELPRRFSRIPEASEMFESEMTRVLAEVWDESSLLDSVDRHAAQVRSAQDDPDYADHVAELRTWIEGRRSVIEAALAAGLPEGNPEIAACALDFGG